MSRWLYRAETKGIQSWILQSNKLRELVGGSRIIDELPEAAARLVAAVKGGDFIVRAAGNLEIAFGDEAALHRFAAAWPLVVDALAPGLTVIQAWCPEPSDPRDRSEVFTKLGKARNLPEPDLPPAGPLVARAGRTGMPAVSQQKKVMLDRALQAKLDRAVAEPAEAGEEESEPSEGKSLQKLAPEGWTFLTDSEQLGGGQEENYLAVIHADGNKVGLAVNGLSGEALATFATRLDAVTKDAAKNAFAALSRVVEEPLQKNGKAVLPARPIVVGGDDLTVLVTADHALAFTDFYLREFQRLALEKDLMANGKPLTASAGVAFVKTAFPFDVAHALAESLCKGAKKSVDGSAILFHRVTTASTDTEWSDILQAHRGLQAHPSQKSHQDKEPEKCVVLHGPYNLDQIARLDDLARAIRPLPRKALREWIALARTDLSRASQLLARTQEVADKRHWSNFLEALAGLGHGKDGWTSDGRTAIPDALTWRSLTPGISRRLWSTQ